MKKYRAAIAGLGWIGQGFDLDNPGSLRLEEARSYAGAFRLHRRFELAAACDPNPGKRRSFERAWRVSRSYKTVEELLRAQRPDILAVACSTRSHAAVVRAALAAPKPPYLILEKPFCGTVHEARAAALALRRARARAVVNYSRRWLPEVRRARRLAASGTLGLPRRAVAYYTKGLLHNGCHMVDLLSFFLGRLGEPRLLKARSKEELDLAARAGGADIYLISGEAADYSLNEADILFSRGRVRVSNNGRVEVWRSRPHPWAPGARRLEPDAAFSGPAGPGSAMSRMLDDIAGELQGRKTPGGCRVEEALRTLEFCERAQRLAAEAAAKGPQSPKAKVVLLSPEGA
ncbi:MAG: Gfo/Idh/MocA family oxidoreductase [Elusimicrobia bacterium]|nr:Gfo/Idh/MocA family oxidoreductase [Elusimicrobiota bacterium]